MSHARTTIWLAAIAALLALLWAPSGQSHAAKPKKEASTAEEKADKPADRYALPAGGPDALAKFMEDLKAFSPRTTKELFAYREQAPRALKAAAEKILTLEKNRSSEAYTTAFGYLLERRIQAIDKATPAEQQKLVDELCDYLRLRDKKLSVEDARLAQAVALTIEEGDIEKKFAAEAYAKLGQVVSAAKEPDAVDIGERLLGANRRLQLTGKEMELDGTTMGGKRFDWKSYRGKVVLVDFWATWCDPCMQELPNVQKNYALYHDRGFDIVGISIDEERDVLEKFLQEKAIPWTTLNENGAGWKSAIARQYGVMGIPTAFLVDKKGKVVSLDAQGPELVKLLADLLGPANPDDGKPAGKNADKSGDSSAGGKEAVSKEAQKTGSK